MGKLDLSLITISNVIIHDVPKHKKGESNISPKYSENESTITDGLRSFFQAKVREALNSEQAFKICFAQETDSIVPTKSRKIITNDNDFVEHSKKIAENLFNKQVGINTAGLLLIIKGNIEDKYFCVVMKLERDNGAQLVLDEQTKTFNMQEVENLMLTQKTKVFKVALFVNREKFHIDYDGNLMDYQINYKAKKTTTNFFLDFLGCVPYRDPKFITQEFYNRTTEFISTFKDPIIRSKYTQDLNSYLQKNQNTISPREFSDDYMDQTEHKNQYKLFLESKNFPYEPFAKDNSMIEKDIKKIMIEFENDIVILGKDGSFQDKVTLTQENELGMYKAEIIAKIKKVK